MVKTAFAPAAIGDEGKATRLKPQVVLSWALCEPRFCGVVPPLAQGFVPLLLRVSVAVKACPAATVLGTLLLTIEELLVWPLINAMKWVQSQYGPGSVWVLQVALMER